jgi:phage tail-like protein
LENEIPNYFVLNKHSELWEDNNYFGDKGYVSLDLDVDPYSPFRLRNTIGIPLRLSYDNNDHNDNNEYNNSTGTESTFVDPNALFSFDVDRYNMLYLLEKDTKKIRRLSIDRYEQYGTTNTDRLIFDEYIISCKGLEKPQSIAVTDRHIYVLDGSILYVLSKTDYKLINTLEFRDKIYLFKLTDDEGVLFYCYSNNKRVVHRRNLIGDYESPEEYLEEDKAIDITGNSKSSDYRYTGNEDFENIIDIAINNNAINNKLKTLYILTRENLYSFYFEGKIKPFANPIRLRGSTRDEFSPTSLAIDEEKNEIFIGSTAEKNSQALRKLTFSNDSGQMKEGKLEKIEVETQSQKIFLSRALISSSRRLLIFNFIPSRYKNKDSDPVNSNENEDGTTKRRKEGPKEGKNQTGKRHLSCKILEEYYFYKYPKKIKTKKLDSLDEKTRWYKITIDQDIPPNTLVKLSYLCSDHEMPEDENWTVGSINSNNTLILDCVGRYLKLKVDLSSFDQNESPSFSKMVVYFSMPTYMRYLPEIYHEDEQSKIFLERFLSIFQTLLEETENKISSFIKYLDVRATPEEYLHWLSSWLSLSFDEGWGSGNIRSFLERAPDIFRKRGTREGIEEILSIYLEKTVRNNLQGQSGSHLKKEKDEYSKKYIISTIGDDFGNRLERCGNYFFILEGKEELNELSGKLSDPNIKELLENNSQDVLPYCFFVFLNPILIDYKRAEVIKRIIEEEKPAHTVGIVRFLQESHFQEAVGAHDSQTITRDRNKFVLGKCYMSNDTFLSSTRTSFESSSKTD